MMSLKRSVKVDTSQTTRELAARFDILTILNQILKQISKIKKLDRMGSAIPLIEQVREIVLPFWRTISTSYCHV